MTWQSPSLPPLYIFANFVYSGRSCNCRGVIKSSLCGLATACCCLLEYIFPKYGGIQLFETSSHRLHRRRGIAASSRSSGCDGVMALHWLLLAKLVLCFKKLMFQRCHLLLYLHHGNGYLRCRWLYVCCCRLTWVIWCLGTTSGDDLLPCCLAGCTTWWLKLHQDLVELMQLFLHALCSLGWAGSGGQVVPSFQKFNLKHTAAGPGRFFFC